MQGSQAYNQATSLLLAFESVPLLLAPSSLIWILAPVPREITVIETLLARCTAFALLLLAFLTLLLSGELGRIWVAAGRLEDESVDASHAHANSCMDYFCTLYQCLSFYLLLRTLAHPCSL